MTKLSTLAYSQGKMFRRFSNCVKNGHYLEPLRPFYCFPKSADRYIYYGSSYRYLQVSRMLKNIRTVILKPFSLLYWGFLLFLLVTVASSAYVYFRDLLIEGVGIPPEFFGAILFLSLVGSFINIPLKTFEVDNPIVVQEQVHKFGVDWVIPQVYMGKMKTLLTINLGGGVVPIFISL
ncbi:DUF1614 domain-containing protein, partial [Candidatus Bathyarchaeota archaeon]